MGWSKANWAYNLLSVNDWLVDYQSAYAVPSSGHLTFSIHPDLDLLRVRSTIVPAESLAHGSHRVVDLIAVVPAADSQRCYCSFARVLNDGEEMVCDGGAGMVFNGRVDVVHDGGTRCWCYRSTEARLSF